MQKRSCLSSHFVSIPPHAPHTPLLTTCTPHEFHKKNPLQKLSDPHNDKVDFVIVRISISGGFCSRQEAMHVHGTSSVSHTGSLLKALGGMRVDHELVRSRWQLSTVHDGRLSAVWGSRARSGVKIEDHEEHEEEHEEEQKEEWWSIRNLRRSTRGMRKSVRSMRRSVMSVRSMSRSVRSMSKKMSRSVRSVSRIVRSMSRSVRSMSRSVRSVRRDVRSV